MENEVYVFFIFILNGFLIGLVFDCFRVLRKVFKTSDIITYIQDILFWIITGFMIMYSLFKFNGGYIRGYIFLGIIIGYLIYYLIFSKIFIKVNVYIIKFINKIIYYLFFLPIKKIVLKPITFIFINTKKTLSKLINKCKKLEKNCKIIKK